MRVLSRYVGRWLVRHPKVTLFIVYVTGPNLWVMQARIYNERFWRYYLELKLRYMEWRIARLKCKLHS